jgi:hypothetical protein
MTNDPEIRASFLDMAHQWETMARQHAQLEAERKQD